MLKFKPIRVQIASDLHLDVNRIPPSNFKALVNPSAPTLILAGDIAEAQNSTLRDFLHHCSAHFNRIVLVAGNHEYYNNSISKTNTELKELENEIPRFRFLNNETLDIAADVDEEQSDPEALDNYKKLDNEVKALVTPSVRIIGSTLWSRIPAQKALLVKSYLNDYKVIRGDDGNLLNTTETNQMHLTSCEFIDEQLSLIEDNNSSLITPLVVTHHSPLIKGTSHPMYEHQPTNCAFSTDLPYLLARTRYWVHGHTHYTHTSNSNTNVNIPPNTLLLSNQYGYNSEQERGLNTYNKETTIEIKNKVDEISEISEIDINAMLSKMSLDAEIEAL